MPHFTNVVDGATIKTQQYTLRRKKGFIMNHDITNEVLAECAKNGSDSMIFKADVSDSAAVNDMIKAVSEKYESIDVVVNNSGITKDNLILAVKPRG